MCGIAGCWEYGGRRSVDELRAATARMTARLAHRGPDGEGLWVEPGAGLALGHRRLSIIGGAESGRQPMRGGEGRYAFVVNGELYNYRELRKELEAEGRAIHGDCDSEVMLCALAAWGVDRALARFDGMFAFALWDGTSRTLHLGRDRMGEKPLYYGGWDGCFVFGSELKALAAHPAFDGAMDESALARFFRYAYIGEERSIYRAVRKLAPGTGVEVREGVAGAPVRYWDLAEVARATARAPFRGTAGDAVSELESRLRESVRLRMRADVPVGAFLSGGLDSAAVVALASREGVGPVRTFSIGSADAGLDEAPAARALAAHFGTAHSEAYLDEAAARALLPQLPKWFDEPFGDASALPVSVVSALARGAVKTVLSGDGGDELLGGYERYRTVERMWRRTRWLPGPARRAAGRVLERVGGERLRAVGGILAEGYPRSLHWHLVSHWKDPGLLAVGLEGAWRGVREAAGGDAELGFPLEMLQLDAATLLPGDMLVKLDRTSMAVGLEARLPYLSAEMVSFCYSLPAELRFRDGQAKWVLREVVRRHVPEALLPGRKKGFAVPLAKWLRGPWREWAEERLAEGALRESGVLAARPVRTRWEQHLAGRVDWSRALWNVLVFQEWDRARRRA